MRAQIHRLVVRALRDELRVVLSAKVADRLAGKVAAHIAEDVLAVFGRRVESVLGPTRAEAFHAPTAKGTEPEKEPVLGVLPPNGSVQQAGEASS